MSWINIWIHLVFSTKNGYSFLDTIALRQKAFQHIRKNAKEKDICLDCVNGHKEQASCLLSLGKEQKLSKMRQLIKGVTIGAKAPIIEVRTRWLKPTVI
jgi:REP element-mobilizing transposase RayT